MHVGSTNFIKKLFCKRQYDVISSLYAVTMAIVRHCSKLKFGREACSSAFAQGVIRPLHANEKTLLNS